MRHIYNYLFFFFFNDTATTEIYTLSLHDALPILFTYGTVLSPHTANPLLVGQPGNGYGQVQLRNHGEELFSLDRKSTRLNSSHGYISYAVFCLKKKKVSLFELLLSSLF